MADARTTLVAPVFQSLGFHAGGVVINSKALLDIENRGCEDPIIAEREHFADGGLSER